MVRCAPYKACSLLLSRRVSGDFYVPRQINRIPCEENHPRRFISRDFHTVRCRETCPVRGRKRSNGVGRESGPRREKKDETRTFRRRFLFLFRFDGIGTIMAWPVLRLKKLLLTITAGLRPACSCPRTGSRSIHTISPRLGMKGGPDMPRLFHERREARQGIPRLD